MRPWMLSSCLLVLIACGKDSKQPSVCERAVDHGIELMKAELAANRLVTETCGMMPDEVVRCYVEATTHDAALECGNKLGTAPITIEPGSDASPEKAALCKRADDNYARIEIGVVTSARADRIAQCKADGERATTCQLAATKAHEWVDCEKAR